MHLTTLVENTSKSDDLASRNGLSLYLENHGKRILFDMGPDDTFFCNAEKLGVDISRVDYAILSHGHYDHCGGLQTFLKHNTRAPVFLGSGADETLYSERPEKYRYIGLDKMLIDAYPERFSWVEGSRDVTPWLHLTRKISMAEPRPESNRGNYIRDKGIYLPDPFAHEILCIMEETDGMILLTGCGHSGILNMVDTAQEYLPDLPVKAVIGGFHLVRDSRQEVERIAKRLSESGCGRVITGHCTGHEATQIMKDILGDRLDILYSGYTTEI
jgi:7,8-dihydropterin-6-yl-methyl-4-(beta-D-ribofuranosyl)aminobenzene 5'-phosphate synthase